jgi:hypothetical protein
MVSCNIVPNTLRCSVSFARKVFYAVISFTEGVTRPFAAAIGSASQLLMRVAIASDTPPPFGR